MWGEIQTNMYLDGSKRLGGGVGTGRETWQRKSMQMMDCLALCQKTKVESLPAYLKVFRNEETHPHSLIHLFNSAFTTLYMYMHTNVCTYRHTCIYTSMHMYIHIFICMCIRTYAYVYTYIHAHIHTRIQIHASTYTHSH